MVTTDARHQRLLGTGRALSFRDKLFVNALYKCNGTYRAQCLHADR